MRNDIQHQAKEDWDFIAFTYGGLHSIRDLKIYRISNNNRYQFNIKNPAQDKHYGNANTDGTFYLYSQLEPLNISINFAYDNLFQEDIRKIKRAFNGKEIKELIFEEYPYKVYDAKVTGQPVLNYNVFDDNDGRTVYKGTGSVTFTCYYPFAHTPTDTVEVIYNGQTYTVDGKYIEYYEKNISLYPTIDEWKTSAKLLSIKNSNKQGVNTGEKAAPFIIKINGDVPINTGITVAGFNVVIKESTKNLIWNSKTGLITGECGLNSVRRAIKFNGFSQGELPVTQNVADISDSYISSTVDQSKLSITYSFWYY